MNYLLALLGYLLFISLGMLKTKRKHPAIKFDPVIYLKDELLTLFISAISALSIVLLMPEVGEIIAPKFVVYTKTLCFLGGFLNYAIIDRVINIVLPKKVTQK